MKARDIMTASVITVRPEMPVRDVAALMTEQRISGVPVVSTDGKIQGIVSQSDLLHRRELGTEMKHKWWLRVFSDPDSMAREFSKAHGLRAADIMTRRVVSVSEDSELGDVAAMLDRNQIKRVPVVRNGRLVGVIARSDLVKALSQLPPPANNTVVDNATLHRALVDKMKAQSWFGAGFVNTVVTDGHVQLWGQVDSHDQHLALRLLVEETAGVKAVEDHLVVGRIPMHGV
jgi:CBS domain-containing protein